MGNRPYPSPWSDRLSRHLELGHRLMQLADGLTFLPPEIRQNPREQTRKNVNDLDRETPNLRGFPDGLLRS